MSSTQTRREDGGTATDLRALLTSRARATPDAPAVTAGRTSFTYRQLFARAERLADALVRAGARPDGMIGVAVDRSAESVVAVLGTVLSGAAYVPIAADLPADRVRMIASDARPVAVTGVDRRVAEAAGTEFVPVDGGSAEDRPAREPAALHPDHAAYAIFTSGSTGRPKGVVISHRSVVSSTLTRFGVYPAPTTYAMLAPLTIDAAVAGLYFTLAAGGRLLVPDEEEIRDPQLLADLLVEERVSHLDGLPSQYAALLRYHPEALAGLRCVVLGGEALPHTVARLHLAEVPGAGLHNEYGPTESTVWATTHRCSEADPGPHVPIGRAIPGLRAEVLTGDLRPAAPGEVGEIYLSGQALARGYLGRPGLTAERFVALPGPDRPGQRMYRTGDLGHVDEAGELVYHGRSDHLVKVRGFRVELGEVETCLLEHPAVLDVAVVPHAARTGVRLVAVAVLAAGSELGSRELSGFAAARLPGYMVPSLWRRVDGLPTAVSGKVDRLLLSSEPTTVGSALPA
ncbi:amino acid adenylation domain-containing protein [Kitasatospora terrestris]|uniref:Amino acid adenylation domain-containing protein n=1 Tax=Kitasatospora terrestris TaxID=258051 RepID=A0ABP9D8C0_9ACTN